MKKMKQALAVLLAVLLTFSSVSVLASAYGFKSEQTSSTGDDFSTLADDPGDRNIGITTKFFRQVDGEWVPTNGIVKRGEAVKARIYYETNYRAGTGEMFFIYNKDFFDFTEQLKYTLNKDNPNLSAYTEIVAPKDAAASTAKMMNRLGYLPDEYYKDSSYGYIELQIKRDSTKTAQQLQDLDFSQTGWEDNWFVEFDMTVKSNADPDMVGKTGDVFVIPSLIMDTVNDYAHCEIEATGSDGSFTTSQPAYLWLVQKPLLQSDPQRVVNDVVFYANGGKFADGGNELDKVGYVGDTVAASEIQSYFKFPVPTREGFTFNGWAECDEDGNVTGTPVKAENIVIDYDPHYYAAIWGEGQPKVTLNANEGKFPSGAEEAVFQGAPGDALDTGNSVPTRDGYVLDGWSTDPDATKGSDLPANIPDSSQTYYAVWTPLNYKLTYHIPTDVPNAVFAVYGNPEDHACGSEIDYADAPNQAFIPAGYYFDGWKVYDPDTKTYTDAPAEMPAGNLDVYAYCSPITNQLKYYIDGKLVGDLSVETDKPIPVTDPSFYEGGIPEYGDKEFDGWYTDEACTKPLADGALVPAGGVNLYAKTAIPATFDPNGGTLKGSTDKFTESVPYGAEIPVPEDPQYTGYTFKGWTPIPSFMDNTDGYTFTATWEPEKHAMTYKVDGRVFDEYTFDFGAPVTEFPQDPESTAARTFVGWDYDGDGVITAADVAPATMPAEDQVINAIFEDNTYDVTYHIAGETDPAHKDTYKYDAALTEWTAPSKTGKVFDGWYTNPDMTGEKWTAPAKMPGESIDLYGKYADETHTIKYYVNGELKHTDSIDYGKPTGEAFSYSEAGKTVSDWSWGYINDSGETVSLSGKPDTMPAYDVIATATMDANKHDIVYKVDGEEYKTEKDVEVGSIIEAPDAPEKPGYTFSGWEGIPDPAIMPDNALEINGTFIPNKNDITYLVDGEEYRVVKDVPFGTAIETIPAPAAKEGYTFSGWQNVPATMPDEPVTIEGVFTANKYPLTINYKFASDGTEAAPAYTEDVAYGQSYNKTSPVITGYTANKEVVSGTMGTSPVTEEVIYTANNYKVTYYLDGVQKMEIEIPFGKAIEDYMPQYEWTWSDSNGTLAGKPDKMPASDLTANASSDSYKQPVNYHIDGTAADPDKTEYVTVGATVSPWTADAKEGYDFDGWYTDSGLTSKYVPGAMPEASLDLYGKYVPHKNSITYVVDDAPYQTENDVEFGTPVTPIADPEKADHTFSGWKWYDKDGNEIEQPATMPDEPITAKGTFKLDEYEIKYYTDSETTPADVDSIGVGEPVPDPEDATRPGYSFDGWKWYDKDGREITKPDVMPAEDIYAIAQWTANDHTVTYDLDGGDIAGDTADVVVPVKYDEVIPSQQDPEKADFVFAGWKWFDSTGKEITKPEKMPDDDITAVAQWKVPGPNDFTLTYEVDGTTYDAYTLEPGADVPVPENDPAKFGFIFKGWKYYDKDGNEIEKPETMPEGDVKAVAQWQAVPVILPVVIPSIIAILPVAGEIIDVIIDHLPTDITLPTKPVKPTDPDEPTDPTEPVNPTEPGEDVTGDDEPSTSESNIPDTGSAGSGIAAFAAISVAVAAAYVFVSKKKDDDED